MLQEYKLYEGKEIIRFDEVRHSFWNQKGERLIGVTSATGVIDKSGPLMYWAVNTTRDYLLDLLKRGIKITETEIETASKQHRIFKKKAADIGTAIHEWVANWIDGKKPEMPDNEKVVNGITAFLKFQKEHKFKWIESERVVYSKKYKFAGFLDAVALDKKSRYLVDFKSSKGIYSPMLFQTAGYQLAYEEEIGKKFDKRIIIKFGKEDGNFEVMELNDYEKDKEAFLSALNLKRRLKELD